MADDSGDRTEDPTARRLKRARDDGQVARSGELPAAAVMISSVFMLLMLGEAWFKQLSVYFGAGFTFDRKLLESPMLLPAAFGSQLLHGLLLVLPLMLLTMVVAILASGATGGFLFSFKSILPDFSKLNPITGMKKIVGVNAAVELLKAILKMVLIGTVLVNLLSNAIKYNRPKGLVEVV